MNEKGEGKKDVSIGIHPLVKVFSSREEVCHGIGMPRDVI